MESSDTTRRDSPRISDLKSHDRISDSLDEQSPLLPARTSDDVGHVPSLSTVMSPDSVSSTGEGYVDSSEKSKSSWYLFLLTISIGG
jgi:solute carrier family 45 protein 1/2/4